MKVLNLYAGIGGNRKLWKDVDITAIEINPNIASIYHDFFPQDEIIITDAHEFLLNNFNFFDFIWSSPPCPTHSDMRRCGVQAGRYNPTYPDMKLYEEIIFLMNFCKSKWVVENVQSYYDPLIRPVKIGRHYFWSNFLIDNLTLEYDIAIIDIDNNKKRYGFSLDNYEIDNKRKILRNLIDPVLGEHILKCAFKQKQLLLTSDNISYKNL